MSDVQQAGKFATDPKPPSRGRKLLLALLAAAILIILVLLAINWFEGLKTR